MKKRYLIPIILTLSLLFSCQQKQQATTDAPQTDQIQNTDDPSDQSENITQNPQESTEILVSAAASMTDVLNEMFLITV